LIIEGLITTVDEQGCPHVSPLGPVVDEHLNKWTLRPFKSSNTFQNLRNYSHCCFHVTDDVLTVVSLVLKKRPQIQLSPKNGVWIIESACQWFHLKVKDWDLSNPRTEATADVVDSEVLRPFWGWNRAKHAILEAAILMTRTHLLTHEYIEEQFAQFQIAVEKTAGENEHVAWNMILEHWASIQQQG